MNALIVIYVKVFLICILCEKSIYICLKIKKIIMDYEKKALELVYKYSCLNLGEDYEKWKNKGIVYDYKDVVSSLILVDEIIEQLKEICPETFYYWFQIKIELEILKEKL